MYKVTVWTNQSLLMYGRIETQTRVFESFNSRYLSNIRLYSRKHASCIAWPICSNVNEECEAGAGRIGGVAKEKIKELYTQRLVHVEETLRVK